MDALDRYQDVKGGYASFLPAFVQVRVGPVVQQAAASVSHLFDSNSSPPNLLPDGSERIYLFHIRKTAGTSLVRSFLALGGENPSEVERRISRSLMSRTRSGPYVFTSGRGTLPHGDYFFGWSHMPAHRLRIPSKTFTIALLRDPVSRVLSYYRYLLAGDAAGGDMAWRIQKNERALAGNSFAEYLRNLPKELLLNQLYMFSPRYDVSEAVEKILGCSAIMMAETFERDLRSLALALDVPLEYRRDRVTVIANAPVDERQVGVLRDRLAAEYEVLERLHVSDRPAGEQGHG